MKTYVLYVDGEVDGMIAAEIVPDDNVELGLKVIPGLSINEKGFLGHVQVDSVIGGDNQVAEMLEALDRFSDQPDLTLFLRAMVVCSYKLGLKHGKTGLAEKLIEEIKSRAAKPIERINWVD